MPTPVPKEFRDQFVKLAITSDKAEKHIMNGPLLGHQSAYIVFNAERKPILIVYLQGGTLVTHHAHEVAGEDTFQAFEGWTSYNVIPELTRYLQNLGPEKEAFETPFLKWLKETQDEAKRPSKAGVEQAGAGQPATRPESKSQGSDKPQQESEGSSR